MDKISTFVCTWAPRETGSETEEMEEARTFFTVVFFGSNTPLLYQKQQLPYLPLSIFFLSCRYSLPIPRYMT
jgi:hypothetical protein